MVKRHYKNERRSFDVLRVIDKRKVATDRIDTLYFTANGPGNLCKCVGENNLENVIEYQDQKRTNDYHTYANRWILEDKARICKAALKLDIY